MAANIRVFQSIDTGAPALSGTVGSLIPVLDACLLNGYNQSNVASIARSGTTATVTTTTPHGFNANYNDVVTVAGAAQSDYNGDFTIVVTGATTFTYDVANNPATPATGTITCKRGAVPGWTKAFSGTNLAAYKSTDGAASGCLVRVDDTAAQYAAVRGYETMTDVNTGAGPFPTVAQIASPGLCWSKSNAASGAARPWLLIADSRFAWLFIAHSSSYPSIFNAYHFGDIESFKAGDAYQFALLGDAINQSASQPNSSANLSSLNAATSIGSYMPRSYSQTGTAINPGRYGPSSFAQLGGTGFTYPNAPDGGLLLGYPVMVSEGSTVARGIYPGLFQPLHNNPLTHGDTVGSIVGLTGRTLFMVGISSSTTAYKAAIDIAGPWRPA